MVEGDWWGEEDDGVRIKGVVHAEETDFWFEFGGFDVSRTDWGYIVNFIFPFPAPRQLMLG